MRLGLSSGLSQYLAQVCARPCLSIHKGLSDVKLCADMHDMQRHGDERTHLSRLAICLLAPFCQVRSAEGDFTETVHNHLTLYRIKICQKLVSLLFVLSGPIGCSMSNYKSSLVMHRQMNERMKEKSSYSTVRAHSLLCSDSLPTLQSNVQCFAKIVNR